MTEKENDWKKYWRGLLEEHKLESNVEDLDQVDKARGHEKLTEKICYSIYQNYSNLYDQLKKVEKQFLEEELSDMQEIHLRASRVKAKDSLLAKVITKRYDYINSKTNDYARLDEDNFSSIITDLVGVRLILNYRGNWTEIHKKLLERFPLCSEEEYDAHPRVMHCKDRQFQAERPKVYYAQGDDSRQFEKAGLVAVQHPRGYRSIHYVVSYHFTYIEIQVRTIYDEAWSDCDHNYVYKHEANAQNRSLKRLSGILCNLTNATSDIGETMHDIYYGKCLKEKEDGTMSVTQKCKDSFDSALGRLEQARNDLQSFKEDMVVE